MLRKSLGPIQIQLISIGGIIGSAYFLGVGQTLSDNGPSAVIAYLIGGLIVGMVAMSIGELSIAMPREGSFVSQSRELMGRHIAAGVGWSYWFNWCAYIPSEMIAGGFILHGFFPHVSVLIWAIMFGGFITAVNLFNVSFFGKIESMLALLKIGAIGLFTVFGIALWVGLVGNHSPLPPVLSPSQVLASIPGGPFAFLVTMVLIIVNYQGAELVAVSAAESKEDVGKSIPRAAMSVALGAIALYVIPLILLFLIFPWQDAKVDRSVFAEVLSRNGFKHAAELFELVILVAAVNCANSGLYGAIRALYGLGKEGLAPKWLTKTNDQGVPHLATWFSIAICWCFLPLYTFFEGSTFYTWLLSVSGFTGSICWISITYCQIKRRKNMEKDGTFSSVAYKMPGFPYISWFSFWLQMSCLLLIALHPLLRSAIYLGIPAFVLPATIYWFLDRAKERRGEVVAVSS